MWEARHPSPAPTRLPPRPARPQPNALTRDLRSAEALGDRGGCPGGGPPRLRGRGAVRAAREAAGRREGPRRAAEGVQRRRPGDGGVRGGVGGFDREAPPEGRGENEGALGQQRRRSGGGAAAGAAARGVTGWWRSAVSASGHGIAGIRGPAAPRAARRHAPRPLHPAQLLLNFFFFFLRFFLVRFSLGFVVARRHYSAFGVVPHMLCAAARSRVGVKCQYLPPCRCRPEAAGTAARERGGETTSCRRRPTTDAVCCALHCRPTDVASGERAKAGAAHSSMPRRQPGCGHTKSPYFAASPDNERRLRVTQEEAELGRLRAAVAAEGLQLVQVGGVA